MVRYLEHGAIQVETGVEEVSLCFFKNVCGQQYADITANKTQHHRVTVESRGSIPQADASGVEYLQFELLTQLDTLSGASQGPLYLLFLDKAMPFLIDRGVIFCRTFQNLLHFIFFEDIYQPAYMVFMRMGADN
jgi:hypothetical protein